jgi:uncharacterized protein YdhG (YjbR/CyaY superfamily)
VFTQPCRFDRWPAVPTHVVVGAADRFFPREFQQRVARERLNKEVDEVLAGHLVALSNPEGLATRLLAYARELRPSGAKKPQVEPPSRKVVPMRQKPETIDAYLATVGPERRAALEKLRKTILSILPDAEECISYSMPAFRHDGRVVAGFVATSKGCSYFPFSGKTLATVSADVRAYGQTKSALHFDPKHPLPVALVRKLLKARIAEMKGTGAPKTAGRATARSATSRASKR